MLYLTGNPCKLLRAVRVTLQDCFLCILKKSFVIAEMGWYILWLFLSWCSFHGTSHLVLVDKIRSWFISWNQFHSVLQQHPLQDQAECHSGEWFVLLRASAHAFPVYCTYTCQFIIFALGKIFISVKGLHWVSWGSELPLMQMTAAVFLTLCTVDRLGNSKDLSGSTAELTAPTAAAINISGSNNHGCLFFPKLSVSMTGLFWRWLLFWHITGPTVTAPCLCSVCMLTLNLPPVLWRGWHAASAHSVQRKPHWHQSSVSLLSFLGSVLFFTI